MKKKKLLAFFLTLTLAVSITACGDKKTETNNDVSVETSVDEENTNPEKDENETVVDNSTENATNEEVAENENTDKTDEKDDAKTESSSDDTSKNESKTEEDSKENAKTENKDTVKAPTKTEPSKPADGHTHSYNTSNVKATCTEKGYVLHKCSCGDSYKDNETAKLGHSFGGWKTVKEATSFTKGTAERKCANCGKTETKELDKLPLFHEHSYSKKVVAPTCTAKGYTLYKCECGDSYTGNETAKKAHSYNSTVTKPTCTTGGYTTYKCSCGSSYVDNKTEKLSHSYTDKVVAPTCTKEGYTQHTCKNCGSNYTDAKKSSLGHDYKFTSDTATCTSGGTKTETCSRCNDKKTSSTSAKGHDIKVETKEATCTSDGYKKEICKTCGTTVSNQKLTASGTHNWTTKDLGTAAVDESSPNSGLAYAKFKEYNVKVCTNCKYIDYDSITQKYSDMEMANKQMGYVNNLRSSLGLNTLTLDSTLVTQAVKVANKLITNYQHYNTYENIAKGQHNMEECFYDWKASSGHYAQMTNQAHKYFGYGQARVKNYLFACQLFGQ